MAGLSLNQEIEQQRCSSGVAELQQQVKRIQTRGKLLQWLPHSLRWFTLLAETCNFALNRDISQPTFFQCAANQHPALPAAKSFILKV